MIQCVYGKRKNQSTTRSHIKCQWRIQLFIQFLPPPEKNCMELKEFGPLGLTHIHAPPLRSANESCESFTMVAFFGGGGKPAGAGRLVRELWPKIRSKMWTIRGAVVSAEILEQKRQKQLTSHQQLTGVIHGRKHSSRQYLQWRIQDPPEVMGQSSKCHQHIILPNFHKKCITLKEFGPGGGGGGAPLDPPMIEICKHPDLFTHSCQRELNTDAFQIRPKLAKRILRCTF